MLNHAIAAFQEMLTAPFRRVLLKTLGATLLLLFVAWFVLVKVILVSAAIHSPWIVTLLALLTGIGLLVGLIFAAAPVSFVVAGFFFDELALTVETDIDPTGPHGRPTRLFEALWLGLKFAGVALLANAFALLLLLIPGFNAVAFFVVNAYLAGRGYYELAALRYRPIVEVRRLRKRHAFELFVAGLFIAVFLAISILNLLTPLFATAFMVRVQRAIALRDTGGLAVQTPL